MKISHLLPGYSSIIEESEKNKKSDPPPLPALPFVASSSTPEIEYVTTGEQASQILKSLQTLSIRAIAIDSEYQFSRPAIRLRNQKKGKHGWNDIRAIVPLVLSCAVWLDNPESNTSGMLRYVFDLRESQVKTALKNILRLRVPMVFHNIKAELFVFWTMEFESPIPIIYDTYIAAASIHLGLHHPRAILEKRDEREISEAEEIEAKESASERREHLLSLAGQCVHYGIPFPFGREKEELRSEFLALQKDSRLTLRQIEYAAADAESTLRLYVAQQNEILQRGLATHLYEIEFPYAMANARIEWEGLYVSQEELLKLRQGCEKAWRYYEKVLQGYEISKAGSKLQFLELMQKLGLMCLFKNRTKKGNISTTEEILELLENNHEAIRAFRLYRKYKRLAGEEWLSGILTGADGRIHPNHRQLGAQTGRNTCSVPNIVGIGKIFRPIVKAPIGRAVLEIDFGQIEVGVAAAEYQDRELIQAYNSGDVYAVMAKQFYSDKLSLEDLELDLPSFEEKHSSLRDNMKTFVLAVLYNILEQAIAAKFGISVFEAKRQRERFLDLYPTLKNALENSALCGWYRGHATTITGLRRQVHRKDYLTGWCRNYLRNTPIQGSAAIVFKRAVILLNREFMGTKVKIILTAHDAVLIECPIEMIESVASKVSMLMEHAVRSFYPELVGKVKVNKVHPECWNKNGHFDSLDKFLADPMINFEQLEDFTNVELD